VSWVGPVTLAGVHVRLEPAGEEHLADLVAAGADPIVWAHMPWPQPRDRAAMRELLELERRVALPFAQIDVPSGRAVGITTYRDVDERNRTLEIGGTWLGRPWWRTGANRVAIKTDIRNERSQAAIARLGARREGVLRHQMIRPDGSLRDTVIFSVIPEEWPAVREHLRARLAAHTVTTATPKP
jgi:RimJ/RimL family protein N-acetyltransferase